ncbi:phosphatase PAP2 family protein [Demequina phytophila]|uniref:phosphatase PAP2 family protein n=1 Tax=Demequina phytophila TaxID=1638981 RepID=UPI0007831D52|nr:phosphatase PAP2 family protein [Demequina phytophila]
MIAQQGGVRPYLLRPTVSLGRAVGAVAAMAVLLFTLGFALRSHPVDAGIVRGLNELHVGLWGVIASGLYRALEPIIAIPLVMLLAAVVWKASRDMRLALAFSGVVALTWLPTEVFKVVVARPRPDMAALAHPFSPAQSDGSFPSGHTVFVAALAIAVFYLLKETRWATAAILGGVIAIATISVAVVSDGLHYPTDVIASICWALAMAPVARWLTVDLILPWLDGFLPSRASPMSEVIAPHRES